MHLYKFRWISADNCIRLNIFLDVRVPCDNCAISNIDAACNRNAFTNPYIIANGYSVLTCPLIGGRGEAFFFIKLRMNLKKLSIISEWR